MSAGQGMKTKRDYPYWIKERVNPQIGTYFVACGQMSKTEAKKHEDPMYGRNAMHKFGSKRAYNARLRQLAKEGKAVQT